MLTSYLHVQVAREYCVRVPWSARTRIWIYIHALVFRVRTDSYCCYGWRCDPDFDSRSRFGSYFYFFPNVRRLSIESGISTTTLCYVCGHDVSVYLSYQAQRVTSDRMGCSGVRQGVPSHRDPHLVSV